MDTWNDRVGRSQLQISEMFFLMRHCWMMDVWNTYCIYSRRSVLTWLVLIICLDTFRWRLLWRLFWESAISFLFLCRLPFPAPRRDEESSGTEVKVCSTTPKQQDLDFITDSGLRYYLFWLITQMQKRPKLCAGGHREMNAPLAMFLGLLPRQHPWRRHDEMMSGTLMSQKNRSREVHDK